MMNSNNNNNNNNATNPSDPTQAGAIAVVNQEGQGNISGTSSVVSGNGASLDSTNDGANPKEEEEVDENSEAYKLKQAKAEEERIAEETALAAARAAAEANQPVTAMGTGAMCVTIAADVIEELKRLAYVREETALVFQAELEEKGSQLLVTPPMDVLLLLKTFFPLHLCLSFTLVLTSPSSTHPYPLTLSRGRTPSRGSIGE